MSHVYFTEVRMSDSDDYVGDIPESPTRQRPRLTRKQAEAAWKEEREFFFFSELMRSSTSYRGDDAFDELISGTAQKRNYQSWVTEIENDRQERDLTIAMITKQIEEHNRKYSTGECSCTERRQEP